MTALLGETLTPDGPPPAALCDTDSSFPSPDCSQNTEAGLFCLFQGGSRGPERLAGLADPWDPDEPAPGAFLGPEREASLPPIFTG